jgi:hypothetical protein
MIAQVIVACADSNGEPSVVPVKVKCTMDQLTDGLAYVAAKNKAEKDGYDLTNVVAFDIHDPGFEFFDHTKLDWKDAPLVII